MAGRQPTTETSYTDFEGMPKQRNRYTAASEKK
jgi:hypothetical protein